MEEKINCYFVQATISVGAIVIEVIVALLIMKVLAKTDFLFAVVCIALVVALLPGAYYVLSSVYDKVEENQRPKKKSKKNKK